MGGCVAWYVGECFRACGRWPCYFVFWYSNNLCFYPLCRPALAYFRSTTINAISIHSRVHTKRVRDRRNLVLEAAEIHLTLVFKNQQQGVQQGGSNIQWYTNTKPALPCDRQTTQTAAAQTGTTVTARLSHLHCFNESGMKAATLRYYAVTNANVSVDTIYDLRLAQPNKKKTRRTKRADFCACVIYAWGEGKKPETKVCPGSSWGLTSRESIWNGNSKTKSKKSQPHAGLAYSTLFIYLSVVTAFTVGTCCLPMLSPDGGVVRLA